MTLPLEGFEERHDHGPVGTRRSTVHAWGRRSQNRGIGRMVEFLTVEDVAADLRVSTAVVHGIVRHGTLPARGDDDRLLIERGMYERWLREQYAKTRAWVTLNPSTARFHGDWRDWPMGAASTGSRPTTE